ncbi:10462_t:CDS:2, partial [Racocetra fulgida]
NNPMDGTPAPLIYFVWPPFAFYRALSSNNHLSSLNNLIPMKLSDFKPGKEIFNAVIALIIEYSLEAGKYVNGDDDVRRERSNILSNQYGDNPLVVKSISKIYNNGKVAVKDIAFAVESGTIFGLLGPNGAEGDAILNGLSISASINDIYRNIGVYPQRDILWDNLTEQEAVHSSLKRAQLVSLKTKLTENLDNKNKRRLSIAIALVGEPSLVFLDEPTTGLDPEARRSIWKIIANTNKIPLRKDSNDELFNKLIKKNSTIILATHSMEEAEVLCNKIGIMSRGTLRCMGAPSRLKQLYGRGFRLNFNCKIENLEKATV